MMLPDSACQKLESIVLPGVVSPCFQAIAAGMIESKETVGTTKVKVERILSDDLMSVVDFWNDVSDFDMS